jgi:hypothetical protein
MLKRFPIWIFSRVLLAAGVSFFAFDCDYLKIVFEDLSELAEEVCQVLGNGKIQVCHVH